MDTDTADLIFAIMGNTEKGQLVSVLVPFLSAFFGALSAYYFQVNKEKKSEVRKQKLDLMHFFRINTVILSSLIEFKSNFLEHNEELFDELTIFCNSAVQAPVNYDFSFMINHFDSYLLDKIKDVEENDETGFSALRERWEEIEFPLQDGLQVSFLGDTRHSIILSTYLRLSSSILALKRETSEREKLWIKYLESLKQVGRSKQNFRVAMLRLQNLLKSVEGLRAINNRAIVLALIINAFVDDYIARKYRVISLAKKNGITIKSLQLLPNLEPYKNYFGNEGNIAVVKHFIGNFIDERSLTEDS